MFPFVVVYFVVHKLRTMTPNSSDTRAHIAHSVRFHLFHVIRHRRKQSRRSNSITEKDIGTQHSNQRLLLRTNTSPLPIWTFSFFRLRRYKNSQNLKDPEDRMFWQATSSSTGSQQFGVSERNAMNVTVSSS
jgi:hypothetical protein